MPLRKINPAVRLLPHALKGMDLASIARLGSGGARPVGHGFSGNVNELYFSVASANLTKGSVDSGRPDACKMHDSLKALLNQYNDLVQLVPPGSYSGVFKDRFYNILSRGSYVKVTLQLQPLFKRNITNLEKDDGEVENMVLTFGLQHEFGAISWYPSQHKAVYKIDDRVPVNALGNGTNDFFGFRPFPTSVLQAIREGEEGIEEISFADGFCIFSNLLGYFGREFGRGFTNDGENFTGYPVTGFQDKMQTSGSCLASLEDKAFPWDPRVKGQFFHEIGFSIGLPRIRDFLLDVKKIRDMDSTSFCGVDFYDGILICYVKVSSAYLGKEEDSINVDILGDYDGVFFELAQSGFMSEFFWRR
ncbi:hypothetical protein SUGI_0420100 [Cryptomeria japonica]|nr:hypothetical protein SUGI_0420100 [Cryptomeria japonica]